MTVEYRVLGPLQVLADGEPVVVPAGRGRVLLATLLLRANEFVSVDELVDRLWEGAPPAADRAHKTLQTVVLRLRQALGAANCVRTVSGGYTARVEADQLDLTRFRALVERGEFRAALELWRGPVLADVVSEALHRDDVPPLLEEQVVALERRIDQDLTRDTDVLVPELRSLIRKHPLRETFWAQLMLALHRSNQQAEALAVYEEVRAHLADELGVDPGRRLRDAHRQVLGGEAPAGAVPRQLPAGVPHFVGRERELARLSEMMDTRPGEPVLISAINGIGGVGKTALAVQWAHRQAERFPDGQLYVNLRGFDVQAEPVDPFSVARDFLAALGMNPGEVPKSDDALVAAYRSALAKRRMLLLLDNARDVDQVRPLLPGGAANLVLITSRNRLSGLVAREGAQPVALDVLDEPQAVALLTERFGADRIAAEPEAVRRLVERCAGLPLALGIVAARAAYGDSLTALADELDEERLDALDLDDPTTGIRAVFSWSLRSVSDTAAGVFVLLGLHPGPDFTAIAVASLAALPMTQARRALTELVGGNLVHLGEDGRYTQHDLLRDYAAERAAALPAGVRADALRRMFDHYLHSAHACWQQLSFNIPPTVTGPPAPGVLLDPVRDVDTAWTRFEAERWVLLSAVERAAELGADDFVWRVMHALHGFLSRQGHQREAEHGHRLGLAAAQRLGDFDAQSIMHRRLAATYINSVRHDTAEFHLREAIRCARPGGDVLAEAHLRRGLAFSFDKQGRYAEALDVLAEVHPRIEDHHDSYEVGRHLAAFGRAHLRVGDGARALELCLRAAEKFAETEFNGQDEGPSANQENLGEVYLALGRHAEAIASYERALVGWREMRSASNVADGLILLGTALIAAGDTRRARECLTEARQIIEGALDVEFELHQLDRVRDLLAQAGGEAR
ncbi:BTAD domain-containing putative transcriptional regulator [Nocardia sp. NRRL S-836]|uniref:AfsR/SARP family transcriptional regulator n=1 Tax=Nocardia sp. NRRL S-836 TaxID=1519492 RepID=UPI0006B02D9F|nr:BTAD domain-containing putative transcriptional regulator [Nocardia sp. NRRL S-836]